MGCQNGHNKKFGAVVPKWAAFQLNLQYIFSGVVFFLGGGIIGNVPGVILDCKWDRVILPTFYIKLPFTYDIKMRMELARFWPYV